MTLTEFLLARFDDDERAARKLAEVDRRPVLSLAMTVNHPERLLLEIEAKRRIVESTRFEDDPRSAVDEWLALGRPDFKPNPAIVVLTDVLKSFATSYADHPDFDESWRP